MLKYEDWVKARNSETLAENLFCRSIEDDEEQLTNLKRKLSFNFNAAVVREDEMRFLVRMAMENLQLRKEIDLKGAVQVEDSNAIRTSLFEASELFVQNLVWFLSTSAGISFVNESSSKKRSVKINGGDGHDQKLEEHDVCYSVYSGDHHIDRVSLVEGFKRMVALKFTKKTANQFHWPTFEYLYF